MQIQKGDFSESPLFIFEMYKSMVIYIDTKMTFLVIFSIIVFYYTPLNACLSTQYESASNTFTIHKNKTEKIAKYFVQNT